MGFLLKAAVAAAFLFSMAPPEAAAVTSERPDGAVFVSSSALSIGSVVIPRDFPLAGAALSGSGLARSGAMRSVPVSGSFLLLGSSLFALGWVGWRRLRASQG